MKKIAVIGATGYVGRAVVQELINRGHHVTAFARKNTENLMLSEQLTFKAIDVNAPHFSEHLVGFDAIVSAFNAGWNNPNIAHDYRQGAKAIIEAAKKANTPYLLIVGGAGSLYVAPNKQLIDTPEFPKDIYEGANAARHLLTELQDRRDVNWAFVSPPALLGVTGGFSEERTGTYRLGSNQLLMNGNTPAGMSVADFAIAVADDAEKQAHPFKHFTAAWEVSV